MRLAVVGLVLCAAFAVSGGVAHANSFSWSAPYALDRTGTQYLSGVACPSATQCTAVDQSGGEVTFDPTSATPNSTRHTIDSGRQQPWRVGIDLLGELPGVAAGNEGSGHV